jgi:hypothetical protein
VDTAAHIPTFLFLIYITRSTGSNFMTPPADIVDRLGAALHRSRPEPTGVLHSSRASALALADALKNSGAARSSILVEGLQDRSPSPPAVEEAAAAENEAPQRNCIAPAFQQDPEPGLGVHSWRNETVALPQSPRTPSKTKSVHAMRAEAAGQDLNESLSPGSHAAKGRSEGTPLRPARRRDAVSAQHGNQMTDMMAAGYHSSASRVDAATAEVESSGQVRTDLLGGSVQAGEWTVVDSPSAQQIRSLFSPGTEVSISPEKRIDDVPAILVAPAQDLRTTHETLVLDELTMETLILAEIEAVQHVVVAGCGRQYMACLVTLKVESGPGGKLAREALDFAHKHGSDAQTVEEARACKAFHVAILHGFAACNKMVWEASRRIGLFSSSANHKAAQLRRYTILPEPFSHDELTLCADGSVNRERVLELFSDVVESMYGAATSNQADAVCVSSIHPSTGLENIEAVRVNDSSALQWPQDNANFASLGPGGQKVPNPLNLPRNRKYNDFEESTQSTQETQAMPDQHPLELDINYNKLESPVKVHIPRDAIVHDKYLLTPAKSLPEIERDKAPYVLAKEPTPNFVKRSWSYLKTFMPCFGTHSQALDDDILNPHHTIVKRVTPGRKSTTTPKQTPEVAANLPFKVVEIASEFVTSFDPIRVRMQ